MKGIDILIRNFETSEPRQAPAITAEITVRKILAEDTPCDDCEDVMTCRECECACEAWFLYEHKDQPILAKRKQRGQRWSWREGSRIPCHSWFKKCFPLDDVTNHFRGAL